MAHRIFIGWSGEENRKLANLISDGLKKKNLSPVVGGEWSQSFAVSMDIIQQMNGCDFGIFLIEKETRKNSEGKLMSMGFNPNVMMELGYMLNKLKDPNRVRRVLLNMDPGELPSDLQGMWSFSVKKATGEEKAAEENQTALQEAADTVVEEFSHYMENYRNTNKLDYFDNWEENSRDILRYNGDVRISEKLIYGMQAAIYSDRYEDLLEALEMARVKIGRDGDRFGDLSAIRCAIALLNVFAVSNRLTKPLNADDFDTMSVALEEVYEKNMTDPTLKTWCEIFRKDKLELCYELYAAGLSDAEEKSDCLNEALSLCNEILVMIEKHINTAIKTEDGLDTREKNDEMYALLYKAFTNRNISQIHKQLAALNPENAGEHREMEKKYCAETLQNRLALYNYYKENARDNTLAFEYISQEYLLALSEQCKFDEKEIVRKRNIRTVKRIYNAWKEHNGIRNMIFDKVTEELKKLPEATI